LGRGFDDSGSRAGITGQGKRKARPGALEQARDARRWEKKLRPKKGGKRIIGGGGGGASQKVSRNQKPFPPV